VANEEESLVLVDVGLLRRELALVGKGLVGFLLRRELVLVDIGLVQLLVRRELVAGMVVADLVAIYPLPGKKMGGNRE